MVNNSKHIASIINFAVASSKCNDNIVSTFAVDFNNNVLRQHWKEMSII